MKKFTIEQPDSPAAFIEPDYTQSPVVPKRILLIFDPGEGDLYIETWPNLTGTPAERWYRRVLAWELPARTDAIRFANLINNGALDKALNKIMKHFRRAIVNDNVIGTYEGAEDAIEDVQKFVENAPEITDDIAGLWSAYDYFDPDPPVIAKNVSDEELSEIANQLDSDAYANNIVLYDTLDYLKFLRDRQ